LRSSSTKRCTCQIASLGEVHDQLSGWSCVADTSYSKVYGMKYVMGIGTALLLATAAQAQPTTQQGTASYFNGGVNGHTKTANNEDVQPNSNTAASRTLPLGSTAKVTNKQTGKSTDVRITDRGPTRKDRVIDLSKKSANDVGMEKTGVAPVVVQP
jgi:rare lipoprotein A (peptidoglycan hydrolase)